MSEKYFETIRCEDFEVFYLEYHKKRVSDTIGLNLDLASYIYPPTNDLYRCKIIYDNSEILDVQYHLYKKRDIKSFKIVYDDNIVYNKKYLNRQNLDNLFDKKQECDEIIIIKNGLVTDTTIANIAIFYENRWITPKKPLLYGTTRARLLENEQIFQKDITLHMLKDAKQIALLNAMIGFDKLKEFKLY